MVFVPPELTPCSSLLFHSFLTVSAWMTTLARWWILLRSLSSQLSRRLSSSSSRSQIDPRSIFHFYPSGPVTYNMSSEIRTAVYLQAVCWGTERRFDRRTEATYSHTVRKRNIKRDVRKFRLGSWEPVLPVRSPEEVRYRTCLAWLLL